MTTLDYSSSTDVFADMSEGNYSSSDYPAMATMITAASRLIDAEMGRWPGFFAPSTDAETWYFDGSGELDQPIGEFASITTVSVSEQGYIGTTDYTDWTINTDYMLWPYNYAAQGKPITKLRLAPLSSKGGWYGYDRAVRIVGIPGYSTTPPAVVVQACKMQAVEWFMSAKQGYQDTGASAEIGGLTFSVKNELSGKVKKLLESLKLELCNG
jgi:hypothetical protein